MGLKYKFKKANQIIAKLSDIDLKRLDKISHEIEMAQDDLLKKGQPVFKKCKNQCKGLCCRNLEIDMVISLWDFVYILAREDSFRYPISKALEKENIFHSSNCIFLENGVGPCIFPPNSLPEVCVTSFCNSEPIIRKEIRLVKYKFVKLWWFFFTRKYRVIQDRLFNSDLDQVIK